MRPFDLPEYDRPPVVEVVLSVQFSELRAYRTIHAGILWQQHFKNDFPKVSEQPELPPTFEIFGAQSPRGSSGLSITQALGPPVPRLWFCNRTDTELVQFQADRFAHNWRKVGLDQDYPRYEYIRSQFFKEFELVSTFAAEYELGELRPNQCEVTYVNHIALEDGENILISPYQAFRFFSDWRPSKDDEAATLPRNEDSRFSARFVMEDGRGNPVGRLLVAADPAVDRDLRPMYRLTLTARGAPASTQPDAISAFFDMGRIAIVRGFTALTTAQMHRQWRRKR